VIRGFLTVGRLSYLGSRSFSASTVSACNVVSRSFARIRSAFRPSALTLARMPLPIPLFVGRRSCPRGFLLLHRAPYVTCCEKLTWPATRLRFFLEEMLKLHAKSLCDVPQA
jgi:hypothetical protein